jgi:hypothetical protein
MERAYRKVSPSPRGHSSAPPVPSLSLGTPGPTARRRGQIACLCALWLGGCGFLSNDPVTYTVGGQVQRLADGERVTLGNGEERIQLSADGTFTFEERHERDTTYDVFVASQPATQHCDVRNGRGTIGSDDVTNVVVECRDVLQVSWSPSRHSSVNRPGGGYIVYYSAAAGFHPEDPGVATIDVQHDAASGRTPTSTTVPGLDPGTWYFRVQASSELGRSALSAETEFLLEGTDP